MIFYMRRKLAMGMIPFMMESATAKHGLGIDGKVRIVNELRSTLMGIRDPVARSLRIKQLAEKIDVEESILLQKLRTPEKTAVKVPLGPVGRKPRISRVGEKSWRNLSDGAAGHHNDASIS
jgi:DNA primase